MLDLIIRSDRVVTPHGAGSWEVAVQGQKIVAVAAPGTLNQEVGRVIDATGKIVVPGGIDPHVHCKYAIPVGRSKLGETGPVMSADPSVASRAALFGGTTMMVDFAYWKPGKTIRQTIEEREPDWQGQCYCDYAYHILIQSDVPPEVIDEIPETIQEGFPSIKVFTTNVMPNRYGRRVMLGPIWEIMQRAARHGGITFVHAEDDEIVMHMYDKLAREGRTGFEHIHEAHNTLSEDLAFQRVIRLAENVEGAALYMAHVSAGKGVQAIAEARAKGFPIYGETLPHYAVRTSDEYRLPNGQVHHTFPSLKGAEDNLELWKGMADGSIGTVATDGICTPLWVKVSGQRIDDVIGGHAGFEPRLGVTYVETVVKRGMSLERFVDLSSANAARILGMYPRKGAIAAGSDADLAIIDPNIKKKLSNEDLHETDYSPWEGWEIAGWPVTTILRGKVVVENGEFHGDLRDGERIKRKIADAVLSKPVG